MWFARIWLSRRPQRGFDECGESIPDILPSNTDAILNIDPTIILRCVRNPYRVLCFRLGLFPFSATVITSRAISRGVFGPEN
jgi:hypothetical protein